MLVLPVFGLLKKGRLKLQHGLLDRAFDKVIVLHPFGVELDAHFLPLGIETVQGPAVYTQGFRGVDNDVRDAQGDVAAFEADAERGDERGPG